MAIALGAALVTALAQSFATGRRWGERIARIETRLDGMAVDLHDLKRTRTGEGWRFDPDKER